MPDLDRLFIESIPLIDVRSPGEFASGHFPNSVNLPILSDEERKEVGIAYKHQGQEAAIELGHRLVSNQIREERVLEWVSFLKRHPHAQLYCARGGLRSQIATRWIQEAGIPVKRIEGGYKALRSHLLERMEALLKTLRFQLIGGKTGSGKTHFLRESGLPHIDLEALAQHRGSSFGAIGPQPSQAVFENALIIEMLRMDPMKPVLLEDESIMIGSLQLPLELHHRMKESPLWILNTPLSERIRNIARDYVIDRLKTDPSPPQETVAFFLSSLERIAKKLGGLKKSEIAKQIRMSFEGPHFQEPEAHFQWIEALLVEYYDPYYEKGLEKSKGRVVGQGTKNELASRQWVS
jgi:tRNA 2-selenouridine synthase